MKKENFIKLEIPSKSVNESFARATVACFVAQTDPTLEELNDIKTAVSEAITNCIVHAYPEEIGKILLKATIFEDNSIEIIIRDWGKGISDITKAREPMFTTGGDDRSGMGFTIMESFMDDIKIRSSDGRGTTVTLKRKITNRGKRT